MSETNVNMDKVTEKEIEHFTSDKIQSQQRQVIVNRKTKRWSSDANSSTLSSMTTSATSHSANTASTTSAPKFQFNNATGLNVKHIGDKYINSMN